MLRHVPWRHWRNLLLFITLLLSFNLACGLGQFLGSNSDGEATPAAELDGGSSAANEADNATITEAADVESSTEVESSSETNSAESNTSPESTQTEESAASAEPIKLAEDQFFVLAGNDPTTLDPHKSGDATSARYVVEIYSGLMTYDLDLNLIPDVAESYEISEDGLIYTFKIRAEALFQDGKPITAQDFKWSFERGCDPATDSRTADTYLGDIVGCRAKLQGQADEVAGVEVIADHTLQLTIDEPKGFFLAKLTYPTAYVLDRENVESGPEWHLKPNGSGPFVLDTFDEGIIIFTKNENYYRDPKPTLERVIYLVDAPLNPMTGYQEGLASLGLPDDVYYDAIVISIGNLSQATDPTNDLNQEFTSTPDLSVSYIGFNVNQPPFDDPKVRQAFNLALDKRRMVKLIFQDTFPVANGIVPPTMPGYQNPDLSDYEFDPEQALALIAESSYGDVSEFPEITLHVNGTGGAVGPIEEAIVASYQDNLGLEIAVEQTPFEDFLNNLKEPDTTYQMYELGWVADYPDPQNFLEILFHSESTQNYGGYNNPEVDALLDQAKATQDVEERQALYQQAEQLILTDAAWIPLFFSVENWVIKPYVHGFQIPPMIIPKLQYVSIAEH